MIAADLPDADDLGTQFSLGWKWGFLVAVVLALATAPFRELPKYYAAIPAGLGVALAVWVMTAGAARKTETEIEEPAVREFRSDLWLQIKHHKACQSNQLDLFEQVVEDSSERRRIHHIRTDAGNVYVVLAERWQELLVSRVMDTTDKATEHALAVALKRCGAKMDPRAALLLSKIFREQVKSDFRGSVLTMLSREGSKLAEDLAQQAVPVTENVIPFVLEAREAATGKKRAKV